MAQVNGYKLNITVVSDGIDAKNKYLKTRPASCKFFSIDNKSVEDDYGALPFNTVSVGDIEDGISEILIYDASDKYTYLFIGLDDDGLNSEFLCFCIWNT